MNKFIEKEPVWFIGTYDDCWCHALILNIGNIYQFYDDGSCLVDGIHPDCRFYRVEKGMYFHNKLEAINAFIEKLEKMKE